MEDADPGHPGLRRADRASPDQVVPEKLLVHPLYSGGESPSLLAAFSDWVNLAAATHTDGEGLRLVVGSTERLSAMDDVQLVAHLPDGMAVQLPMSVVRIGPERMVLSSRSISVWARAVLAREG
jgi:hypothetical protein